MLETVVFINGSGTKDMNQSFLLAASLVFIAGSLVVLLVVILTSKRMVNQWQKAMRNKNSLLPMQITN